MVLSDRDERVVFISESPGDESLLFGGAIARLRSAGAEAVLFYAPTEDGPRGRHLDTRELEAALSVLDVHRWRLFPGDPAEVVSALRDVGPTAVVIGRVGTVLAEAITRATAEAGIPVFVRRREFEGTAQRLMAIDIHHEVERKLRAIRCHASRWSVDEHTVTLEDGSMLAVTGTETYVRIDAPGPGTDAPATPTSRLLAGAGGLVAGAAFGMLGTVAHQTTLALGQVSIPVGLVLALAGATALLVGLRMVLGDRMVVLLAAIGMLGTIFVLSLRSPGGSVLVPAGPAGTVWTLLPALIAALAVAWPRVPQRMPHPHGVHRTKA
jgi:LmbE family N-acetylglucosaminyl deacetylase